VVPFCVLFVGAAITVLLSGWHRAQGAVVGAGAAGGALLAFNQVFEPLYVVVAVRSYQVLLWCAAGGCGSVLLLNGKQWLPPAYLQQDRPVLLMCFYCFMIEEEVCHSETAAVACGESKPCMHPFTASAGASADDPQQVMLSRYL